MRGGEKGVMSDKDRMCARTGIRGSFTSPSYTLSDKFLPGVDALLTIFPVTRWKIVRSSRTQML